MNLNEIRKPTIEDVLANVSVAKLKGLAKDYYVKGYSKLNKASLVEVVSSALQKPTPDRASLCSRCPHIHAFQTSS